MAQEAARPALADEGKILWYSKPDEINYDHIDTAVRELVRATNACGWMNTTMSCSGHPVDTGEDDSWSGPGLADSIRRMNLLGRPTTPGDYDRINTLRKVPFDPDAWEAKLTQRWLAVKDVDPVLADRRRRSLWIALAKLQELRTKASLYVVVYDMARWGAFVSALRQFLTDEDNRRLDWKIYYVRGASDGSWHCFSTYFYYLVAAERAAFFDAWIKALGPGAPPKEGDDHV